MKILRCDTCKVDIDQDAQYFGADCFDPLVPLVVEDDPDDLPVCAELRSLGENEYHFCSAQCLAEWGFARSLADAAPS